jgi:hypothetical protein
MTAEFEPFVQIAGLIHALTKLADTLGQTTQEWMEQLEQGLHERSREFAEALAEHEKGQAEAFTILGQGGWVGMEWHFTESQARSALEICKRKGDTAMNDAMARYFNGNECALLSEMTEAWSSIPYLRDRQAIITDALSAHREGRFTLTVPSLLPLAEGLSVEILGNPVRKENAVKVVARDWKQREAEIWAQVFADVIENVVYKSYDFRNAPAPYLNRHGILHGQIPDYATGANSVRVFLLIDAIARLWVGKQKVAHAITGRVELQSLHELLRTPNKTGRR